MSVHTAGIRILAESRLQNSRIRTPESLCYEIDGFSRAVCHTDGIGRQMIQPGYPGFKRVGFRFGVVADTPNPLAQVRFQKRKVYLALNVGTEISRYRAVIFVGVISVSFNHISVIILGSRSISDR